MKKKDLFALWEEEGDLERMKQFFNQTSPSHDEKERIKQLTLKKIETLPPEPQSSKWREATLLQRIEHFSKSLWWRWQWKLAIPLAVIVLLTWVGKEGLPTPLGTSAQKNAVSQSMSQAAPQSSSTANAPVTASSARDELHSLPDNSTDGLAVAGGPPANRMEQNSANSSNTAKEKTPSLAATPDSSTAPESSKVPQAAPADESLPRKMTYNVNLSLQVEDVGKTLDRITQEIQSMGGYIASSHQQGSADHASAQLTIKIPSGKLDGLRTLLPELGIILNQQTTANDITNQYYDAETRLRNWEAQEQRYLEILKEAKSVEDILKVENALDNIRMQLEQLKGQLKLWDHEVDYSTVQIMVQPTPGPGSATIDNPWHPVSWSKTWLAAKNAVLRTLSVTWNAFNYLIVGLAYALPYLGLGLVLFIIFRIVRLRHLKK